MDVNLRASGTVTCPGQGLGNTQVNIVEPGRICDSRDIFVKAGSGLFDVFPAHSNLGWFDSSSCINFI